MSEGTYLADSKTQRAVERNLQIIGEAAHKLPAVLRNTHPEIPWDQVYAARTRIVHSYFGVDQTILWDILQQDLDPLLGAVEDLLASRGPEAP